MQSRDKPRFTIAQTLDDSKVGCITCRTGIKLASLELQMGDKLFIIRVGNVGYPEGTLCNTPIEVDFCLSLTVVR